MKSFTNNEPKSRRDLAYYQQRYRNRMFSKVVAFLNEQAERHHLTKKDIAERINKDPAVISRLLSQPSNLTLDTISDLLLAVNAEPEPPEIVLFKDRRVPNYMHPLIARALNVSAQTGIAKTQSSNTQKVELPLSDSDLKIKFVVTAA